MVVPYQPLALQGVFYFVLRRPSFCLALPLAAGGTFTVACDGGFLTVVRRQGGSLRAQRGNLV